MPKKMSKSAIGFYQNIPSLDLHGEDSKTAELLVKQFIEDNLKLENPKVIIVHGIGTGVLKKKVHEVLKKDKRVDNYFIDFFNVGCTIVEFK